MDEQEREEIINAAVERMLVLLPTVITNLVRNAAKIQGAVTKFYDQNPDLTEHKQLVGAAIERLESQHPGVAYDKLASMAAKEVRAMMSKVSSAPQRPRLPRLAEMDASLGAL